VRALPHAFRHTSVRFEISGDSGGVWFVLRTGAAWELPLESDARSAAIPRWQRRSSGLWR